MQFTPPQYLFAKRRFIFVRKYILTENAFNKNNHF
jgi:hypothetical protein